MLNKTFLLLPKQSKRSNYFPPSNSKQDSNLPGQPYEEEESFQFEQTQQRLSNSNYSYLPPKKEIRIKIVWVVFFNPSKDAQEVKRSAARWSCVFHLFDCLFPRWFLTRRIFVDQSCSREVYVVRIVKKSRTGWWCCEIFLLWEFSRFRSIFCVVVRLSLENVVLKIGIFVGEILWDLWKFSVLAVKVKNWWKLFYNKLRSVINLDIILQVIADFVCLLLKILFETRFLIFIGKSLNLDISFFHQWLT